MLGVLALPCSLAWPGSSPPAAAPEPAILERAPAEVVRALDALVHDLRLSQREEQALERVKSAARIPLVHGRLSRELDLDRLARARTALRPLWRHMGERRELLERATDWRRPGLWRRCSPERWALQLYDRACSPREGRELAPLRSLLEGQLAESLLRFDRAAAWGAYARLLVLEQRLPPLPRHDLGRALPHQDWLEALRERLGPPPAAASPAVEGALGLWLEGRARYGLAAERAQVAQLGCVPRQDSLELTWVEVEGAERAAVLAAYDEALRLADASRLLRWRHRWTLEREDATPAASVADQQRLRLARYLSWQASNERWILETRRLLRLQSEAGLGQWRAINDPYRVNQVFGPGRLRSVPRARPPAATGSRPG